MAYSVDRSRKFSKRIFTTAAIFNTISKLLSFFALMKKPDFTFYPWGGTQNK